MINRYASPAPLSTRMITRPPSPPHLLTFSRPPSPPPLLTRVAWWVVYQSRLDLYPILLTELLPCVEIPRERHNLFLALLLVCRLMLRAPPLFCPQRCTIGAMVTLDVHGRDVLTMMVEQNCETTNDFNWIAQLRYYYAPEESPDMQVKIITAIAKYGWEYLGNSFRLVVTQLTDRCGMRGSSQPECRPVLSSSHDHTITTPPPTRLSFLCSIHPPLSSLAPNALLLLFPPLTPLQLLPNAHVGHPTHTGGRTRGSRWHWQDRNDKGPCQGAGEAVCRLQLLRRT